MYFQGTHVAVCTPISSRGSNNATVSPIIQEPIDTRPVKTFVSAIAGSTAVTIETGSLTS